MINIETIYYFLASLGIPILFWYTMETFFLRQATERQLRNSVRPVLSFKATTPAYELINITNNPALNIFVFSKRPNGFYFLQNHNTLSIDSLGPNQTSEDTLRYYDEEKFVTKKKILELIPEISKVLDLVDDNEMEKGKIHLIVVYEDILENKLYTIINGTNSSKLEKVLSVGYVNELKFNPRKNIIPTIFTCFIILMVIISYISSNVN